MADAGPMFDVVITTVDGADREWLEERTAFRGGLSTSCYEGVIESRFRYYGTIRLQVLLVRKCMPFVRKVFVVLSGPSQRRILDELEGIDIDVVYHRDFIPEEYLPTFNSHAIELFLWKIPGLSDFFLYFNDDQFVLGPVERSMFVKDSGVARVATDHIWPTGNFRYLPPDPTGYQTCLLKSSRLAWKLVSKRDNAPNVVVHHTHCLPYTLHRPTCEQVFSMLDRVSPGVVSGTTTRFRDYVTNISPCCTYTIYYGFLHQRQRSLYSDKTLVSNGVIKHCCLSELVPRRFSSGILPWLYLSQDLEFVCIHDNLGTKLADTEDFCTGVRIVRDLLSHRLQNIQERKDEDERQEQHD